jgi:hypothetical protein
MFPDHVAISGEDRNAYRMKMDTDIRVILPSPEIKLKVTVDYDLAAGSVLEITMRARDLDEILRLSGYKLESNISSQNETDQ